MPSERRGPAASRTPAAAAGTAPASASETRAVTVLMAAMAILLALRALAAFDPSMRWWGLNDLRFAWPGIGWGGWALASIAMIPAVARALEPRLRSLGDALASADARARLALAAVASALVLSLPDRSWFVGDFLLRMRSTYGLLPVEEVFPQTLPLDLLLHHHLPLALLKLGLPSTNAWERVMGAVWAASLAWFAAELPRRLELRGVAAAATAGVLAFAGPLALFTGYAKGFVELTLATVVIAVLCLRLVQEDRGAAMLGCSVSVALLLHRSAPVLLLPLGVTAVLWWRAHRATSRRRVTTVLALALPLMVLLAYSTKIAGALGVDAGRHFAVSEAGPAGVARAAFAPVHLVDVLNLLFQAAPFALAAPVLAVGLAGPLRARGRELLILLLFALPGLGILLLIHPRQGMFRDTDVFAPSLAAFAVLAAALVGECLRRAGTRAWLGVPALLTAISVTSTGMSIAADAPRALHRIQTYVEESPRRGDEERALLWSFIAERSLAVPDYDRAAEALGRAAELAPSPRILTIWGLTEVRRRNYPEAQRVFRLALERSPTFTQVWLWLADASIGARDWSSAEEAIARAAAIEPQHRDLPLLVESLRRAREALGADTDANGGSTP